MLGQDTVLQATSGGSEGQSNSKGLTHPSPCWHDLGGLCQGTTYLHTSSCILCSRVLCPNLEQKPTCQDTAINNALRIITGSLKPTPVFYLPVLAGIAPAGLRREAATLALARKARNTTGTSSMTPQPWQHLQADSSPATHSIRPRKRCLPPSRRI